MGEGGDKEEGRGERGERRGARREERRERREEGVGKRGESTSRCMDGGCREGLQVYKIQKHCNSSTERREAEKHIQTKQIFVFHYDSFQESCFNV